MATIRNRFSMRIIALLMTVAIAGSGLASLAALTSTLTLNNSFTAASVILKGNNATGTIKLFDNVALQPGAEVAAGLVLENGGNIALKVTSGTPVVTGNDAMLSNSAYSLYQKNPGYVGVPVCNLANTAVTTMWTTMGQDQAWTRDLFEYTVGAPLLLNSGDKKDFCFKAMFTGTVNTGNIAISQELTGSE